MRVFLLQFIIRNGGIKNNTINSKLYALGLEVKRLKLNIFSIHNRLKIHYNTVGLYG